MLNDYLKRGVRNKVHLILLLGFVLFELPVLAIPPAGTGVMLAWDPSSDPTVTGYNVYYGSSSRNYTNVIPAGSATSATVSNLVSGVTYYFAATTYTATGLESDYSAEASYSVPAPNAPPTLDALTNLTIPQDSGEQTVTLTGITSGASNEVQTLTVSAFSSNPGLIPNPNVTYSSPDTNGTLTFSPAPGSFGSALITVLVDDGGTVSNTVIRSFTVMVIPADNPPTIDPLNDLVINENSGPQLINLTGISSGSTNANATLTVTAVSSSPNLISTPSVQYTNSSSTGILAFSPLTDASGSAIITVTVNDNQPTNNSTSVSFQVTVNQTSVPQGFLTNAIILPNTTFRFPINPPATYGSSFGIALAAGAPAGAMITTRRGTSWLVWTPTMSQASTTNQIGIVLTSATNPLLNTNENLQVIVLDYLSVVIGSTALQAGQNGAIPIALASSDGVTNLSFTMPWPTNLLLNPTLSVSAAGVAASSLLNQNGNVVVTLQTLPGQVLQGSNLICSINFQSFASQPSGYINLPPSNLTAYKPTSAAYVSSFPVAGRVAIINNLAMLQATTAAGPTRSLTVLGKVGNTYQVQYCTNFGPGAVWSNLLTYSQTNVSQTLSLDPSVPQVFYRVQQR
jgi:hypothetical protein